MKIAIAGKGGVGKTTFTAWLADYLARSGANVWMVDADTALSLGQASGLDPQDLPAPLVQREDLIQERIGSGMLSLNPDVTDLPGQLAVQVPLGGNALDSSVPPGDKRLLLMGSIAGAGGGCACHANALLKSVLARLLLDPRDWVLVDLEAGVEHLGRGTVAAVDHLAVVSEPSRRSLEVAAQIGRMAAELGLQEQTLVLNRAPEEIHLPQIRYLPDARLVLPVLSGLVQQQLTDSSVLGLADQDRVDGVMADFVHNLKGNQA
ncbi:MAG: AAA family ATPase [Thermodesulfobacteriota bacterium]